MGMKRTIITAIVFVVLIGFALYTFVWKDSSQNPSPDLTFTSPAGGEVWQTGEEQIIAWTADSIPADYKISLSIRRVPPPPLQDEGQEFDPVIFTNLPNTGSVSWEIHPMYPSGTYVLGLHTYDSLPATDEVSIESKEFTIIRPELNADLYPLYPNADWQPAETETVMIGEEELAGHSVTSATIHADMDPSSVFMPFEAYYEDKLTSLGWTAENNLAAGGPMGGQTGYVRDGQTILIRYETTFQNVTEDAPAECPCDVTLSVFSGE